MENLITSLRHYKSGDFLWLKKDGLKFQVVYSGKEARITSRSFSSGEIAIQTYLQIAEWIMLGKYSDSDRIRYLMAGTVK